MDRTKVIKIVLEVIRYAVTAALGFLGGTMA